MADKNMNAKISVDFEESASRQSLNSGDSLPTLFGKTKKFFSDLKPVALSGSYNDLTDIPKTTEVMNASETSSLITITDAAADTSLISLNLYGRSTQGYATSGGEPLGKNLLSINQSYEISEAAYVWQLDSIVINAGTYTFSFRSSIAVPNSTAVAIIYQLEGELEKVEKSLIPQKGLNTYTFTVDKPIVSIRFYANNLMIGATISEFQLEKGSTATEYEPYYSNPNPECPVPIESIGDGGNLTLTTCGKNLFMYIDYTAVPINPNSNGKITKTADEITIVTTDAASSGALIPPSAVSKMLGNFDGCKITFSCDIYSDSEITISMGFLDWLRVKLNAGTWGRYSVVDTVNLERGMRFYNKSGIAATIKIRNIQIELGETSTDYEPYKSTTADITTALPLRGVPVLSGGNYTDSNGQQWICDELIVNADGTGKIVKRIANVVLDGSDDENIVNGIGSDVYTSFGIFDVPTPLAYTMNILCNTTNAYNMKYSTVDNVAIHIGQALNINFGINLGITTIENVKTWLSTHPTNIIYQLATPTETELTAEEVTALLNLQTFDGVTNIYNSDGGDMFVKYWCDDTMSELITNMMSNKANTSDIVPISGGEMQGALIAQSNTDYTAPQVRNVSMSTEAATGGNNGQIHFQYV